MVAAHHTARESLCLMTPRKPYPALAGAATLRHTLQDSLRAYPGSTPEILGRLLWASVPGDVAVRRLCRNVAAMYAGERG